VFTASPSEDMFLNQVLLHNFRVEAKSMRKGLWRKGLAGGMILLVLGVCVLSNINGTMVTANTPLDRINNPLVQEKYTVLFIGLIKDMVKIDDNRYEFRFVRAVACGSITANILALPTSMGMIIWWILLLRLKSVLLEIMLFVECLHITSQMHSNLALRHHFVVYEA
jgi:hypothetical protein